MGLNRGEAKDTVISFFDAYLVRRDKDGTLSYLTEDIHWLGTGKSELVDGIEEAEQALCQEFAQNPRGYEFSCSRISEHLVSEFCAVILLTAEVSNCQEKAEVRVTAACIKKENRCRIASIHASTADEQQAEGEFFPSASRNADRGELERKIGEKTLDLLGKSIPGGMMGGYLEPNFPLYFINEQMLSYLGYDYDEFVEAIEGRVINCMHPEDRDQVDSAVEEAFSRDQEYEVQYRMRKKDGSYIWVNDIGKKVIDQDGRNACISVIRDISEEMENKKQLQREAAQKEEQYRQYNQLFHSVLCGIVQYRMHGNKITFVKANREAIRIFGYEPDEFWAKDDWDLPSVIYGEDRERILKDIKELHQVGDKISFEYRMCRKDESTCWVLGSGEIFTDEMGHYIIQSVFLDIDERKKAEIRNRFLREQVQASNEILKLALEHTSTCEIYYYPQEHLYVVPKRTQEYYQLAAKYENMPCSFAKRHVAEKYRKSYCGMFLQLRQGERPASLEFLTQDGTLWCRETLSIISCSEDGKPSFAVGVLEDITHQKEIEQALEEAHSRDSLTGLYNKESGIRLVREALIEKDPEECCGLMLLDMDDFEAVNREEGNIFADAVLQEVADILCAETGPDDIQVRLGGDEFMLFIRKCTKDRATVLGPRIAALVKDIFIQTEKKVRISVSIGMCVTEVVEQYEQIYRCTESTLKYVKEHGKGQAACYLDTSNELGISLTQLYTEEHTVNAIDWEKPQKEEDLASFALDLLGKSKNLEDAVYLLFARVGKHFRLDRVSIVEADREYLKMHFTYQWARKRCYFQLGQEYYISSGELRNAARMYDREGVCITNRRKDILTLPSCLHAAIWDCGEYIGSMSFEVNEENYQWTEEERELLKELVKIVPSFTMKARANAVSQAKTNFLSRMSHEIRTPMNAISGMTTIAKSVLDDRAKALDCLNKIEEANTYLLDLINDILDMSRIESGKMELNVECMDMGLQLNRLESLLSPQALGKNLKLYFENEYTDNRPLMGDSLRLGQVLVNMIGNAIKFTDQGSVTVRVEVLELEPDARLRFSVRDTGIGIDESSRRRIFHAFEQADKSTASRRGGTGLGLAISYRLVQMMGGILEVQSQVGKGSEFSFSIPFTYANEGQHSAENADAAKAVCYDFAGFRLLLAEDNDLNREIAQTILEMNGFTVISAVNGKEALRIFSECEPEYIDAILMDINMPVMDGLEAARRIRTLDRIDSRTIPIVALTANAFSEDTKKSLESGMNGHLSKPIQTDQLLKILGNSLKKENKEEEKL